jgi:hypothetical protein
MRPFLREGLSVRRADLDDHLLRKLFILARRTKTQIINNPAKGEVTNMQDKQKKAKKRVKVDDLKPAKDPKGGMPQGPPQDLKWFLKHLQLGQGPGGGDKTGPLGPGGHMPQGPPT